MFRVPAHQHTAWIEVDGSRFVATVAHTRSVEAAREFIATVARERPDATHHVYAFAIGHGASVTHGMSDAGEPSGTAGPPSLAVLRGSDLGDVTLVTSRYFGGRKLGTGGLVRAYTDAAKAVLASLPTTVWVEQRRVRFTTGYNLYEAILRCVADMDATVVHTHFAAEVEIDVLAPIHRLGELESQLAELSSGTIHIVPAEDSPEGHSPES